MTDGHGEIPLEEDPFRGYRTRKGMREALAAADVAVVPGAMRGELAIMLDGAGLSLCRHYTAGGGMEQRRLRCQLKDGHQGQCGYHRAGGQGGTWTRWWGANPAPPPPDPNRYRKMITARDTVIRQLRYQLAWSVWNMNNRPGDQAQQAKNEGRAYGYAKSLETALETLGSPDYAGYPDWTTPEHGRPLPDGAVTETRDYLGARADTLLGKEL